MQLRWKPGIIKEVATPNDYAADNYAKMKLVALSMGSTALLSVVFLTITLHFPVPLLILLAAIFIMIIWTMAQGPKSS